jgi:hypothetical protein
MHNIIRGEKENHFDEKGNFFYVSMHHLLKWDGILFNRKDKIYNHFINVEIKKIVHYFYIFHRKRFETVAKRLYE